MENKEKIKNQLMELLEKYYNGSFAQLVHEYIRLSGISAKEVEEVKEVRRKEKEA